MKALGHIVSGVVAIACAACSGAPKPADTTAAASQVQPVVTAPTPAPSTPTLADMPAQATDQALLARARVSEAAARATALAGVPGGEIKSSELEDENALLIWSFDIAKPGTADISEVQVDALTGKIASKVVETPKDQAKEAAADMQQQPKP